jgi:hypothetical protein
MRRGVVDAPDASTRGGIPCIRRGYGVANAQSTSHLRMICATAVGCTGPVGKKVTRSEMKTDSIRPLASGIAGEGAGEDFLHQE